MEKRFLPLAQITLVGVFLVVLAGSIVRMSGSGMGCPDWPKCFGCWIPPTDESQLNENYQEEFLKQREEKVEKFAKLLELIGLSETANKIRNDASLRQPEEFNAAKTWTEYINRLIGFITGNLMLLMFIFSFAYYRKKPGVILWSFVNLFLILFTAWFGAIVVATNLLPWIITVHMVLAFMIICIQVIIIHKASHSKFRFKVSGKYKFFLFLSFTLMLAQIILGTQVRQQIDVAATELGRESRNLWTENLDIRFIIHRSFSLLILGLLGYLSWLNIKNRHGMNALNLVLLLVIIEVLSGVLLYYAGMPAALQPLHLLLSGIVVAILLHLSLKTNKY